MLTRDEILSLPASREFDAWLAEHAMGWELQRGVENLWIGGTPARRVSGEAHDSIGFPAWCPTTNRGDALELFEKFAPERGWVIGSVTPSREWYVERYDDILIASAPTIQLAICRAVRVVLEAPHE